MPGMDGFETAQEIRKLKDPHYSDVPILALSASLSEKTRQRIREYGMDDYLPKPIDPRDLHQKLSYFYQTDAAESSGAKNLSVEATAHSFATDTPDFSQIKDLYINDTEGYTKLLEQILTLYLESVQTLKKALQEGQENLFRASSHKIMSYVRLLKLQHLQDLLETMKDDFLSYSRSPLTSQQVLNAHFDKLSEAIQTEIAQNV